MAQRLGRPPAWTSLAAAAGGVVLLTIVGWQLEGQRFDAQIAGKRAALKKLVLSGSIPPNQEVMSYLKTRQEILERQYHEWLGRVTTPPLAEAAQADPQVYFQEQFHTMQRDLERLAAARSLPVPEQLGFPKDLPPSDTVPRLLVQLGLVREVAELAFDHAVSALSSLKVEDPQAVAEQEGGSFLLRLPVRVRLTASLPRLMQLLAALHAAQPLIDVRMLRVQSRAPDEGLDVEVLASRYLAIPGAQEPAATEPEPAAPASPSTTRSRERSATKTKARTR